MKLVSLLTVGALSIVPSAWVAQTPVPAPPPPHQPVIRFEDASDKAGIHFTHSFGSRQLGSLLEGTGGGCVWFDYNNSGLQSLFVVSGRPLDD
jgi:hypothetical protein